MSILPHSNPRRVPRVALALFALSLALGLPAATLVVARLHADEPPPTAADGQAPATLAVRILTVEPAAGYELRRVYTGRVESFREVDLGLERPGLIDEVLVREGDRVAAAQLLARLDTALLEAQRAELAAALDTAEADLALAEATLARYRASVDQGAVTRQGLDEAREGARAASAGADLARARIASVELEIAKSQLKAPFDGVVTRRSADEGRVLPAGEPVVRLQESVTPEIRVGIAGPLVESLQVGAEHRLVWRGATFQTRLRALLPVRTGSARTVDAIFTPVDPDAAPVGALRAGDLVELTLNLWIEEPGVWLPLGALTEGSRGLWSAYALEDQTPAQAAGDPLPTDIARLATRPLEVIYQDGDRVFVRGVLRPGERLVAGGLHRVVPGQRVRVMPEGEALAASAAPIRDHGGL